MSIFRIERNQGTAVYAQIAKILAKEFVINGQPGNRLPSESNLADQFGVNRHTLRRAVDELIAAGMLERSHGIGVFVSEKHLEYKLKSKTRFTTALHNLGMTTESKIIQKAFVEAPRSVAEALKLEGDRMVLWVDTLRYADDVPLCMISHFLPRTPYGEALNDYAGGSLHEPLIAQFGSLVRTQSMITAVVVSEDDAKQLRVPNGQPVLRVKSLNVLEQDHTPVEYAITRFRADMIQLRIDMNDSLNQEMHD